MIPKTIHYCWFSGEKKPALIQCCIDSWSKVMPDYTIKCWDGNSFEFDSVPFVRDAMAAKKYAFAADYVRLYALFSEGGIYLDSDVLVRKPFDCFLADLLFCGTEAYWKKEELLYRMEPAIMGAEKGHPFIKQCMSIYEERDFTLKRGELDIVMPAVISEYAVQLGYRYKNEKQFFNDITVYPTDVFANTLNKDIEIGDSVYAIHQNAGSWIDYSDRGWLFHFCRKHHLMSLYHSFERIRQGHDS